MIMFHSEKDQFLVNKVLIAPLRAGARDAEVHWAVSCKNSTENLHQINDIYYLIHLDQSTL